MIVEAAPAKVNLALHVLGRRADGYHDLDSIVMFADLADRLTLIPAEDWSLDIVGPFAGDLGNGADNLVLRAAKALEQLLPGSIRPA
jgi:4-diphosphocytidyl-2-C-methyl-D-erythritol kinase